MKTRKIKAMNINILCCLFLVLNSCIELNQKSENNPSTTAKDGYNVYVKNDSLCFEYNSKEKQCITIPYSGPEIDEKYLGIFFVKNDSVIQSNKLLTDKYIIFSINDINNIGRLYVIDKKMKSVVYDNSYKRNYLICETGIFLIPDGKDEIYCVGKPKYGDNEDLAYSNVYLYEIGNLNFKLIGTKMFKGELMYSDSLIKSTLLSIK